MSFDFGVFNNWGSLRKVAIRDVDSAFVSDTKIDAEWKDLNFHSRPDLANARKEYAVVEEILAAAGAEVIKLPASDDLAID
jgi:arginine deiminase